MLINIVTVDETKLVSQIININRFITYQPIIGGTESESLGLDVYLPYSWPTNYKNQNSERAA